MTIKQYILVGLFAFVVSAIVNEIWREAGFDDIKINLMSD